MKRNKKFLRFYRILAWIPFLFLFQNTILGQLQVKPPQFPVYDVNRIYFKLQDSSTIALSYPVNGTIPPNLSKIYSIFKQYGVSLLEKPFANLGSKKTKQIYRVTFNSSFKADDIIESLSSLSFIEFAEKVPKMYTQITVPNDPIGANGATDPMRLARAYDAFDLFRGGSRIAVVDDAVLTTHEDLRANIVLQRDVADNDDNANPPLTGTNAANADRFSHGTHVAGIAGAVSNNSLGRASIGWQNQIIAIKANNDNTAETNSIPNGFDGITWAAANGARVINLSWGGTGFSQAEYTVVREARNLGIIIVASAGNSNTSNPNYPAAYGEGTTGQTWEIFNRNLVIAVASIDVNSQRSIWGTTVWGGLSGSNFGQWVDIASYGTQIRSSIAGSSNGTAINNGYANYNGTSMAAPLVASLAGLMIGYGNFTTDQVINCLISSANPDIYQVAGNNVSTLGSGRLDAFEALHCLTSNCTAQTNNTRAFIYSDRNTVCPQGNLSLTANTGQSYLWSTGATTQSILITQPGTFSVTVTFTGGCTSVATRTITATNPNAQLIITDDSGHTPNDGLLCNQDFLGVSAVWGNSYAWSAFGATTQSVFPINAGSNLPFTWNFSVTVTGVNGCTGVNQVLNGRATWLASPSATISVTENSGIANDGNICAGATAILRVPSVAGLTYLWSTGATTNSISVTPNVTTTYRVTVTNANGCSTVGTRAISVSSPPIVTISVSENSNIINDRIVCPGADVTLSAPNVANTQYLWSTGGVTNSIIVKPFVTTTYQVTLTNTNSCQSIGTTIITVTPGVANLTILATENSMTPNDGIICEGTNVTLSVPNVSNQTYRWNVGFTSSSLTLSQPSSSASFSVTVTNANGCTAVANRSITVLPSPNADFTHTIVCPTTRFLPAISPGTHSWTITGNGQTFNRTEDSPALSLTQGVYSVSHTFSNSCGPITVTKNITVNCAETFECNCPTPAFTFSHPSGTVLLSQTQLYQSFPNSYTSPSTNTDCISVNGKLIIDKPYAFTGVEFVMQPGGEIVVDLANFGSGFMLNGCNIHSCNKRWKGIEVKSFSKFYAYYNNIQDAENAFTLRESADGYIANNNFNRNFIGLNIESGSIFGGPCNFYIYSNTFDCTSNLLPPYAADAPYNTTNQGYAGIRLVLQSADFGTTLNYSGNIFKNIRNAIVSAASVFTARYLDITKLVNYSANASDTHDILNLNSNQIRDLHHTAIFGSQSKMNVYNAKLGDNYIAPSISKGIHLQNSLGADLKNNSFLTRHTGVSNSNSSYLFNASSDNDITTYRYGYRLHETQNAALTIRDNTLLNVAEGVPSVATAEAYISAQSVAGGTGIKKIKNNLIDVRAGFYGIFIEKGANYEVAGNDIGCSNAKSGIELKNATAANNISDNHVSGGASGQGIGIKIETSLLTKLCCNTTANIPKGINFKGTCTGTDFKTHNFAVGHNYGLFLDLGTTISPQDHKDNLWDSPLYNAAPARHDNMAGTLADKNKIPLSKFLVNDNSVENPSGVQGDNWFDPLYTGTATPCQETPTAQCGLSTALAGSGSGSRNVEIPEMLLVYANGLAPGTYGEYEQWTGGFWAWEQFRNHPEYLGQNALLDNYHNVLQQSNIRKFYDLDKQFDQFNSFTLEQNQSLESITWFEDAIETELGQIDEYMFSGNVNEIDSVAKLRRRGELLQQRWDLFTQRMVIDRQVKTRTASLVVNANNDNEAIQVQNLYEYNEFRVNRIYLSTLAKGITEIPNYDREFLNYLAPRCPLIEGHAVYKARVLRSLYHNSIHYDDVCSNAPRAQARKIENPIVTTTTHQEKVSIYPNPASDNITIACAQNTNYTLIIRNITGQVLKQEAIINGNANIDISNLQNGMIICELWLQNQCVAKEKIIIIH